MITEFFANNPINYKSTISELKLIDYSVDYKISTQIVRNNLHHNKLIPGVIILEKNNYMGLISKRRLFERLSKPYSLELFNQRPIGFLFESMDEIEVTILPSNFPILEALNEALKREKEHFEEPILVSFDNGSIKMLDVYNLILANNYLSLIAQEDLRAANELKSEMLSIAAHDLKNPLNNIISLNKIVKSFANEFDKELNEIIDEIQLVAENMYHLILELLNSNVIESGRIELKKQELELSELVNALIYQNKILAEQKNQILTYIYDVNKNFQIYGDAIRIKEAFENIISNAIKYTENNKEIIVKLEIVKNKILFSVKDQGPGLTNDDISKLFGKFQRLSAQPTGGESSTGLGLYICKQIVEMHNGKIFVESEFGKGSTFFIELDLLQN